MDFCPCAFWQYPWHVSRNATSSDVRKSLDRDRLQQAQNWLHINFGRRHERRAQFIVLLFRQVSLDVVRGDLRIEFAAGEIVEKEQRLGALYEHVVGAHRYKIDADGVVAAEGEGELQLGAHAIRARDQYRVTVFLRQLAQRAETTD